MINFQILPHSGTEWFGFYRPGQAKEMLPMNATRLYKEDWIGLKKMDEDGKVDLLSSPGNHLQFTDEFFREKIVKGYLLED
jgi:palmitoyl-protein thioesterase